MSYHVTDKIKGDRKLGCGLLSYGKRTLFMLVFCFSLSACSLAPDDATIKRAILESADSSSVCGGIILGIFSSTQVHRVEILQRGQFNGRSLRVRAIVEGECFPKMALPNVPVAEGPFNQTVEVYLWKNDFGEWKANF
jgi:hypothetical protein